MSVCVCVSTDVALEMATDAELCLCVNETVLVGSSRTPVEQKIGRLSPHTQVRVIDVGAERN